MQKSTIPIFTTYCPFTIKYLPISTSLLSSMETSFSKQTLQSCTNSLTNLTIIRLSELVMIWLLIITKCYMGNQLFKHSTFIKVNGVAKIFRYRDKHQGTHLGEPGRFQGLNVGVVLLKLNKIRINEQYLSYLTHKEITRLAMKYQVRC